MGKKKSDQPPLQRKASNISSSMASGSSGAPRNILDCYHEDEDEDKGGRAKSKEPEPQPKKAKSPVRPRAHGFVETVRRASPVPETPPRVVVKPSDYSQGISQYSSDTCEPIHSTCCCSEDTLNANLALIAKSNEAFISRAKNAEKYSPGIPERTSVAVFDCYCSDDESSQVSSYIEEVPQEKNMAKQGPTAAEKAKKLSEDQTCSIKSKEEALSKAIYTRRQSPDKGEKARPASTKQPSPVEAAKAKRPSKSPDRSEDISETIMAREAALSQMRNAGKKSPPVVQKATQENKKPKEPAKMLTLDDADRYDPDTLSQFDVLEQKSKCARVAPDKPLHCPDAEKKDDKDNESEIVAADEVCTCSLKVKPVRVVVTGAAGEIALSLLHMIARGEVFGKSRLVIITLFDAPSKKDALDGLVLELLDCGFPLLYYVLATTALEHAYKAADSVVLMGAVSDDNADTSLESTVRSFREQGEAIDQWAHPDVRVLVVGHPANTNCMVCALHAPSIPRQNFTALTRLDQNRARALIANKMGVPVMTVDNIIIWGNHSATQYPDASSATVNMGNKVQRVTDVVKDRSYLSNEFVANVLHRGEEVGNLRKGASSMSEAKAISDHMYDWWNGTKPGKFVSMGVFSDGSYEVPEGVVCSFPVKIDKKQWKIVQGLPMTEAVKGKLEITVKELLAEKKAALAILKTHDEVEKKKK